MREPEPRIRLPSPGVQHREHEPPEHLTLKVSRAWLQNLHRKEGNGDFTLKRCTQNVTHSRTKGKSSNFTGISAIPIEVFKGFLGGRGVAMAHTGTQALVLGTQVFTAVLITVAKMWKQPKCPRTDEWIKMW